MANDLTTTETAALPATRDPTKWMTSFEASALADRGTILPFDAHAAAAAFSRDRLRDLCLQHDAALMPTEKRRLAERLRALWNSTTAPSQVKARDWLAETGRLLVDLPFAVIDEAIDRAVLAGERGFTPNVAAIRAHADPIWADLRRHASRLQAVRFAMDNPREEPAERPDHANAVDRRTTAEILAETWPTMGQHESAGRKPDAGGFDPDRPCRAPTREDYLRMGVALAVLDRLAAPQAEERAEAA